MEQLRRCRRNNGTYERSDKVIKMVASRQKIYYKTYIKKYSTFPGNAASGRATQAEAVTDTAAATGPVQGHVIAGGEVGHVIGAGASATRRRGLAPVIYRIFANFSFPCEEKSYFFSLRI